MAKKAEYCKCVYVHRKATDNTIFYVGIGNKYRPKSKDRSQLWGRIADKYGYKVEVLAKGLNIELAKEIEKDLISYYGRINNKTGVLANLTNGGEGQKGRVVSKKTRQRIRETKINNGMRGGYDVVDKSTGEIYQSLRQACSELNLKEGTIYSQLNGLRKRSDCNTLYYLDESKNKSKKDTRANEVINIVSGEKYKTIKDAALYLGISVSTLSQHLTKFRFKEELKNIQYYE